MTRAERILIGVAFAIAAAALAVVIALVAVGY